MALFKKISYIFLCILAGGLIFWVCYAISSAFAATSAMKSGLIISEVVSANSSSLTDEDLGHPDWVELYNNSASPIHLKDYSISTSKNGKSTYTLPDITLKSKKYLVLYCCKVSDIVPAGKYCTGFKLSKSGTVLFLSKSGMLTQSLSIPELADDISYGVDSNGNYKLMVKPTPGALNDKKTYDTLAALETSPSAALRISEVLPKGSGNATPWVEIYNAGKSVVDLSGYCISDNQSNPTKAHFPAKELSPGAYAVFSFTGAAKADELSFKLGGTETTLILSNNLGEEIDSVVWNKDIFPGISAAPGDGGTVAYINTPTPGAKNGTDYVDGSNFTLKNGEPPVRINEILAKNTDSLADANGNRQAWVELYNNTDSDVSLSGYVLSDDAENIWKWVCPNIILKAKSCQIVFLSGEDVKTGTELHTSFRLGGADTRLILTDTRDKISQVVDLPKDAKANVSYGLDGEGNWVYFTQLTPGEENSAAGVSQITDATGPAKSVLQISEVMAAKPARSKTVHNWVEIHNTSSSPVSLKGYYLSNSGKDLKKWVIPDMTVPANGYAVVNKYGGKTKGYIDLDAGGDKIYLINPQGTLIDEFKTGSMRPGQSEGLDTDSLTHKVFTKPTPGASNSGTTYKGMCQAPLFSVTGGHQNASSIELAMTTPESSDIYYTLDGSTPTKNSKKYTQPIKLTDNVSVHAIACAAGKLPSDVTFATYLFDDAHKIPVVCLSIPQRDLSYVFGSSSRTDKRYRMGYVEYYEADGKLGVTFPADFKLAGNGTRRYAQKSINLYLRGAYGKSSVTYPFFKDSAITTYKSLSLRNSGQDAGLTRMRDAYFVEAVTGMNIESMRAKFCAVYINGKYWGLYEFKENQNADLFAAKHGIDEDRVEATLANLNAYKGSSGNMRALRSFTGSHNMANSKNFEQFLKLVDSDYFTDYLIADTYFLNTDFYNQKYAHTSDNKMKWRPLFYDMDCAFRNNRFNTAMFSTIFKSGQLNNSGRMNNIFYSAFYENAAWRNKFVRRYAEVMNTTLSKDNLLKLFDKMAADVRTEMPRNIQRWGRPSSTRQWENEVASLRRCIVSRRDYAIRELKSFFNLSNSEIKELFPND